jgi:conjugative relaxase-like TrwC/TraI family protein
MLRVIASHNAKGAKEYFAQSLSKEDYYSEGQEISGNWHGLAARRLGLTGLVDTATFGALCDNKKPGTDERLTQRTRDNRTVGYDFNFHCPKSVSVVYEFTKDERILDALKNAVNQTMREIETETKTRVRKNGANENRATGNMAWAEFFHFTARPVNGVPDPHLHAHCYVFNSTWDDVEGKWKAGQFRDLKHDAPYFEAVFHARFARQMADLGYRVERTSKGWELGGVPQRVIQEFSKRTEQIEQRAKELGITSAKGKDGLAAFTRERKQKHLSKEDLRELWAARISPDEKVSIQSAVGLSRSQTGGITEGRAMDFAIHHCYERASIVTDKELLLQAFHHGVGDVLVEDVKRELSRDDFVKENWNGCNWFSTQEVLGEEKFLIDFVQNGCGKFAAFQSGAYSFRNNGLSDEQRAAVLHILQSKDLVTAIRGGAGTGKTTMMKEAVTAIESGGRRVFVFAPSAEAARGVLRQEAGFPDADTVEALLQNSKLHNQIRNQVLWIDEAGLLGARTLARVAKLAKEQNCRIILSGDTAQHRAVERGDALRILEKHANLKAVELKEIWRQKVAEHKALIAELRAGDLEQAFRRMEKLGMLRQICLENRHERLAEDYVAAAKGGKSALVISPTHAEGERVTAEIRSKLKASKSLGPDERDFLQLKNLQWTEAERSDARNYTAGLVIQFHQNAPGFRRGERVTVRGQTPKAVSVERINGELAILPLYQSNRFHVYESQRISLASGDVIRVTQNGYAASGHRLNNGELRKVKDFTQEGDIRLQNGWLVAKDYGNLAHGYCLTSFSAQSKGADCVFIAESSESFRAANREQIYVSASRFKENLTIYTDNKAALLARAGISGQRPSATDLTIGKESGTAKEGASVSAEPGRLRSNHVHHGARS